MNDLPITVKFYNPGIDTNILLDILKDKFENYNWGGGYHLNNFRMDEGHFYCDVESVIFDKLHPVSETTRSYITGVISGYLLANEIEII